MCSHLRSLAAFARYSASQVFAGKFAYFLVLAVLVFFTVAIIHTANEKVPPNPAVIYYFLLVPGVVLVFYPAAYAVQGDVDARMLETLFGIPDYRYKVWLARQLVQQLVIAALLLLLATFCHLALADFSIGAMVFHLMFPILFLSCAGLMIATLLRSGNGAAALMVILVLASWIATEPLDGSRWNLFHNPFEQVEELDTLLRSGTTFYNRVYLLVGSVLATLFALLRLQQREKFV